MKDWKYMLFDIIMDNKSINILTVDSKFYLALYNIHLEFQIENTCFYIWKCIEWLIKF